MIDSLRSILVLLFMLTLFFPILSPATVLAAPEESRWNPVNIPAEGQAGNWVLAKNSDVCLVTQANNGTLYCYANPAGTSYTLFKSGDGGYSWSYTGKVEGAITAIVTAPDNADIVYYATSTRVFCSRDAGNTFSPLALNPGGAGSNNVEITSIDVTGPGPANMIVIGTRDTDNLQYGGIYLIDESDPSTIVNTNRGNYDVYAVSFSPRFASDRQIVAVVSDETSTFVTTRFGNEPWDMATGKATIAGLVPVTAAIVFPGDYSGEPGSGQNILFTAINSGSGKGDVFRIEGKKAPLASVSRDMNAGAGQGWSAIDISGLAIYGSASNALLLAGAAADGQVYISNDSGLNWNTSVKPPTGGSKTGVLLSRDFARSGKIYAFTSGTESAFSISRDSGITWNQSGLIDSEITTLIDLAASPGYSRDGTIFMITFGGEHSLWRTGDAGKSWERVYSSTPAHVDSFDKVQVSPQYADSHVVFISGAGSGNPAIWKSSDGGQKFVRLGTRDPVTGGVVIVDAWAIASDTTLFVGSYDGSKGTIYRSANGGLFFSSKAIAGTKPVYSLALSPDYENDHTILAGNTLGEVFLSSDNAASFSSLPEQAPSPPLTDSITVAFDPAYRLSKTVYAVSSGANKGIHRFVIKRSTEWTSIDSTLPAGGKISGIVTSGGGILYAANMQKVNAAAKQGGMERSLNPAYPLGPRFETITSGLKDNAILTGLWLSGNRLWSVDATNLRLMTYVDSLITPVLSSSPPDRSAGVTTSNARIGWHTLESANTYHWQLDYDANFSGIPTGFEGDISATSVRLPALEQGTTYYWRVRVTEPALSPWSEKRSFTTSLGTELAACKLVSPEPAAKGVPLQPVFQWSALSGAERYELMVATESSFASPLVLKISDYAIPATAWQCDIKLNPGTTYFWRTRAISSDTYSPWSAVGAFTTELPPKPAVTEPLAAPSPLPSPAARAAPNSVTEPAPPVLNVINSPVVMPATQTPSESTPPAWVTWFLYMGGAFLFIMFALLIMMVLIAFKIIRG